MDYSKWDNLDTGSSGDDSDDAYGRLPPSLPTFNDTSLLQCGVQERKIGQLAVDACLEKLASGADPNSCNRMGQTALHIAAIWGGMGVGRTLLKAGANVNARNMMRGSTPLMMAAGRDQAEFAKFLLENGADPMMRDTSGQCAWQMASDESLRMLLGGPSPELTDATLEGNLQRVKDVLRRNPELLTVRNGDEETALTLALKERHWPIARYFINHPDAASLINLEDSDGAYPLHLCVRMENLPLVAELLKCGADPNQKAYRYTEYTSGRFDKIDKATGEKTTVSNEHCTPLLECAKNGNIDIAKLLIQSRCDVDATDGDGCTALYITLDEYADALDDDESESESKDRIEKKKAMAALLLSSGASPNIGNADIGYDNTLLAWASSSKNIEVVKLLLQYKADPNIAGKSGMYPLHMATRVNCVPILQLLLDAGATIDVKNKTGQTALLHIYPKLVRRQILQTYYYKQLPLLYSFSLVYGNKNDIGILFINNKTKCNTV